MADRQELEELVASLDAFARLAPVPMLIADGQGCFLAANQAWWDLGFCASGTDLSSLQRWTDCLEPSAGQQLNRVMDGCAQSAGAATIDVEVPGPSGPRWSRWWIHRRLIDTTAVVVFVALDVHDDVVQRDDLRELATRDHLTGLVNRRAFLETVEQTLRRVDRSGEPAGLLYIDLDSFKVVNDRAGHLIGDVVLSAVAGRLRGAVRGADVVGRLGGDEFAVVLQRLASPGEAAVVARRIHEALSSTIYAGGQTWSISASVGIALTDSPGGTAVGLLASADQDMYSAKRSRPGMSAGGPVATDQPSGEERGSEPPGHPDPREPSAGNEARA